MSRRGIVVVLVVIASVLLVPIAMAYAGCPMMATVCGGPCGVSCAAVSPSALLAPLRMPVAYLQPNLPVLNRSTE